MQWFGLAALCLLGAFLYLDGTGAAEAAFALTGGAVFYIVITALLMRE